MSTDALEKLFDLVMAVGARRPADGLDFIYAYGETDENRPSVVAPAVPGSLPVGVCGRARGAGYSGFEPWRSALVEAGVADSRIVAVGALDPEPINTLTEATSLVRHCIKHGVRRVAVVAPRWHLVRCMMSVVGEAGRLRASTLFVPWEGASLDWDERVTHSQGVLKARRSDLLFYEILRILRYVEKRDLPEPASVLEVLGYLR